MKIGIDCRLAGPKHAGIGRYITELICRLVDENNHQWVLFFFDKEQALEVLPRTSFSQNNIKLVFVNVKHYSFNEQLLMPGIFKNENLDLLHVPHFNIPVFYTGKLIVTIHDLLWHEQRGTAVTTLPSWQYWLKYVAYRIVTNLSVFKAEYIIVPSQTIKTELVKHYKHSKQKIRVITEGYSEKLTNFNGSGSVITRKKNQLLFVGSLYPHKNVALIIKALKKLTKYNLVIVGSRSIFMDETKKLVEELGISKQVLFKGHLSDPELSEIYRESVALVQPSLSEGFGLTGLEALALGTPVLASDISVFREIYQDAAIFFDPLSVDSFVKSVKLLNNFSADKFKLIAKKVVDQYSWDNMANATLEVYLRSQK